MLLHKTLFVVGAGASKEFGLPVGSELVDKISTALDLRFTDGYHMDGRGDHVILEALRRLNSNINPYLGKCWAIRDGIQLSYSIDNFLDKHADDADLQICGRMGIVRCILKEERESKLFVDPRNANNTIAFQAVSNTWLVSLFKMLQDDCRLSHVERFFDNCRIITFNYDRCIQHFFWHALRRNYGVTEQRAAEIVANLELLHVYGRVGALPWERNRPADELVVEFGGNDAAPLVELTRNIMTYADQDADDAKRDLMRSWIAEAHTIVFLGFSYQEQNLDLLTPPHDIGALQVFGSALKISEFNRAAIQRDLERRFARADGSRPAVLLTEATCDETLNDYSRALV